MPKIGWVLIIVAVVVLILFGGKKLPEFARGLGQSLRIFKAETRKNDAAEVIVPPLPAEPSADPAAAKETNEEPKN